jgi:hypothetical protein
MAVTHLKNQRFACLLRYGARRFVETLVDATPEKRAPRKHTQKSALEAQTYEQHNGVPEDQAQEHYSDEKQKIGRMNRGVSEVHEAAPTPILVG